MGLWNKFGKKYGGPNFFPKSLVTSGKSKCKSYGGLKYFNEKIGGSEKISGKNMRVRNSFCENYGDTKYCLKKMRGRETLFVKNMGVRNYFGKNYGGAKVFSCLFEKSSDRVPGVKKDQPLKMKLCQIHNTLKKKYVNNQCEWFVNKPTLNNTELR